MVALCDAHQAPLTLESLPRPGHGRAARLLALGAAVVYYEQGYPSASVGGGHLHRDGSRASRERYGTLCDGLSAKEAYPQGTKSAMVKAFYDDGQVKLHQGDVLAWALDYKEQIDRGEAGK